MMPRLLRMAGMLLLLSCVFARTAHALVPAANEYVSRVAIAASGLSHEMSQIQAVQTDCGPNARVPQDVRTGLICAAYRVVTSIRDETVQLQQNINTLQNNHNANVAILRANLFDTRPDLPPNQIQFYPDTQWAQQCFKVLLRVQGIALMALNNYQLQINPQNTTIPNLTLAASWTALTNLVTFQMGPQPVNNQSLAELFDIRQSQRGINVVQQHPQPHLVPLYGLVQGSNYAPFLMPNNQQRPTNNAQLPVPPTVAQLLPVDPIAKSALQYLMVYRVPQGGTIWYSENNRGYTVLSGGNQPTPPWLVIPRLEVEQEKFNRLWDNQIGPIHVNVQTLERALHEVGNNGNGQPAQAVAAVWWTQAQPTAADHTILSRQQIYEDINGNQQNPRATGANRLFNIRVPYDPLRF